MRISEPSPYGVNGLSTLLVEIEQVTPARRKGSAGTIAIDSKMGTDKYEYTITNFIPGVDTNSGVHIGAWTPRLGLSGPIAKGRAWHMAKALLGAHPA